jgi:probable phosphomutase (TIGR03848 family)
VTLVLLVRHGLTATTGGVLTGWTPGIPLDDRGRGQAAALAARLAPMRLDAIISSPLERCRQTAEAIAGPGGPQVREDDRLGECHYGDWTGKPLKRLAKEPLWRVVQAHPSAMRFPGENGESMLDMQHRAVSAVREWNAALGPSAVYLVCSHGDVIKSVIADSLGMHLDMLQRIQIDPCSLSIIRYTPLRPFVLRLNDTGGSVDGLARQQAKQPAGAARRDSDGAVGGGTGDAPPAAGGHRAPDASGAASGGPASGGPAGDPAPILGAGGAAPSAGTGR